MYAKTLNKDIEKIFFNADLRKSNADKRRFSDKLICDHLRAICGNLRSRKVFQRSLNKKGTIIPVVVVFIIIISLLSATMLMVSNFATFLRARQITNIQDFYLAEAGIIRAVYRCRTKDFRPRTQKIENNAVTIIIEDQGSGNYLITSTAGK